MAHKILIFSIGTTPQVITEALYAIWTNEKENFPEQIFAITTLSGKEILKRIFQGPNNKLEKFFEEYNTPKINFDIEKNVFVVTNENDGQQIYDPRLNSEQEILADFIYNVIRTFTDKKDENGNPYYQINTCLAGGRKTMSYLTGVVMNILGNPDDRLTHVLVDPKYENSDFWYPSTESKIIFTSKGPIDCMDCKIALTDIPLLRLKQVIEKTQNIPLNELGFSKSVKLINNELSNQYQNIKYLRIVMHEKSSTIDFVCNSSKTTISLSALAYAVFKLYLHNLEDAPIFSISNQIYESNKTLEQYVAPPSQDKSHYQNKRSIIGLFLNVPIPKSLIFEVLAKYEIYSDKDISKFNGVVASKVIDTINDSLSKSNFAKKYLVQEGNRQAGFRSDNILEMINAYKNIFKRATQEINKQIKESGLPYNQIENFKISAFGSNRKSIHRINIPYKNISFEDN